MVSTLNVKALFESAFSVWYDLYMPPSWAMRPGFVVPVRDRKKKMNKKMVSLMVVTFYIARYPGTGISFTGKLTTIGPAFSFQRLKTGI
jgi:hypothetical protein